MAEHDTQSKHIIAHLKRYGTITSKEAFTWYGATRLSAIIFDLRKRGWIIETIMDEGQNRYGGYCRYAIYKFISEPIKRENEEDGSVACN